MTGYGKGESSGDNGRFVVEIRSVNHRYGEISVKLPRQFLALEAEIKKRVSASCRRGKVDVFIQYDSSSGSLQAPQVNMPLAKAYHDLFSGMIHNLGLYEQVNLASIISQKDVLVQAEVEIEGDAIGGLMLKALDSAVQSHDVMRLREGQSLEGEIRERVQIVNSLVEKVSTRAPQAVEANSARLRERLARLLEDTQFDEGRLAQEVAILADRMDITEELVRLSSHFSQLDEAFSQSEAVGRKLDFLLQEMNREVNTIGSKANDAEIATLVVAIKAEMEKVREQIQNIE
jgi:uncharacterized protein (TIGR00255 family)